MKDILKQVLEDISKLYQPSPHTIKDILCLMKTEEFRNNVFPFTTHQLLLTASCNPELETGVDSEIIENYVNFRRIANIALVFDVPLDQSEYEVSWKELGLHDQTTGRLAYFSG